MSNTIPLPEPAYTLPFPDDDELAFSARQMREYAAAVTAAKDKEIAQLRAELIKSLADNAALRAEVAGLREDAERYRWLRDKLDVSDQATWNIFMSEGVEQWDAAIDAARKGEA